MVDCYCGYRAIVRISWTNANPGRRFFCCPNPGYNCGFFMWVDTTTVPRPGDVIPALLKQKNMLEASLKSKTEEARWWKMLLFSSWILFVAIFLFS